MTRAHAYVRACANFFFQRVDEERRACARKGGKCVSACGGTTLEVEVEVEVALALALEVGAEGRAHTGAQASRRIVVCTAGVSSIGGQLIRSYTIPRARGEPHCRDIDNDAATPNGCFWWYSAAASGAGESRR